MPFEGFKNAIFPKILINQNYFPDKLSLLYKTRPKLSSFEFRALDILLNSFIVFIFIKRDGCPKIVNLGSAKTDLYYERKKYGFKKTK